MIFFVMFMKNLINFKIIFRKQNLEMQFEINEIILFIF